MEAIIQPTKTGQIVKYHTPFPDEDPDQEYVILEIDAPRVLMQMVVRPDAPNHMRTLIPTTRQPIADLTVVRNSL
jgi:hypothetical protein